MNKSISSFHHIVMTKMKRLSYKMLPRGNFHLSNSLPPHYQHQPRAWTRNHRSIITTTLATGALFGTSVCFDLIFASGPGQDGRTDHSIKIFLGFVLKHRDTPFSSIYYTTPTPPREKVSHLSQTSTSHHCHGAVVPPLLEVGWALLSRGQESSCIADS